MGSDYEDPATSGAQSNTAAMSLSEATEHWK